MHIFKGFPRVSVNLRLTAGKVIERKSGGGGGDNSKYAYKKVKYFFEKKKRKILQNFRQERSKNYYQ